MMTLRQILEQVQADIISNLNTFIDRTQEEGEDWFHTLKFYDEAPRVGKDKYFMGIYLSSPDGQVYSTTPSSASAMVTLDCVLDYARENSTAPEKYLSAMVEYLQHRRYGVSSNVATAVVVRTDLDAPYNGFAVAISVTVYNTDYDI